MERHGTAVKLINYWFRSSRYDGELRRMVAGQSDEIDELSAEVERQRNITNQLSPPEPILDRTDDSLFQSPPP